MNLSGYELPPMELVKRGTDQEVRRASLAVCDITREQAVEDAAYLLEVLGLIEASADTMPARKPSSRQRAAGAPRGKATARHHITVEQHDERLALHGEGLCDREIAKRLGVDRTHILHWRHHYNLPVNRDNRVGAIPTEQARRDAHAQGQTDGQIAKAEGVSREVVANWRYRRGLPLNAERNAR